MALIRDYEIHGTGLNIPNAYHVVTNVRIEKRTADIPAPPDSSHPSGFTEGGQDPEKAVYWKAGYIGHIIVTVWASKQAREEGKQPIGWMGTSPTETVSSHDNNSVGTPGMNGKCIFMLDMNSSLNEIQQAYEHLLSLSYYKDAIQD